MEKLIDLGNGYFYNEDTEELVFPDGTKGDAPKITNPDAVAGLDEYWGKINKEKK